MSANPDSVTNQGQFHSSVPPAEPRTRSGVSTVLPSPPSSLELPRQLTHALPGKQHQLGQQVGNEALPEFRAKTFPPGSAPEKDSYHASPIHATPGQTEDSDPSTKTSSMDPYPGSTSQSVHNANEYGKPLQGQTNRELHGVHPGKRKKERSGLEGVGANDPHAETVENNVREKVADKDYPVERGIRGQTENTGEGGYNALGAENSVPESAESVAAESGRKR